MPYASAERVMDERDAEILDDIEEALNEIADAYDMHVEQIKAVWLGSLDPQEVLFAAGAAT